MFIPASLVGFKTTQAETDEIVNNLALSPADFSKIACLDGRMAGIITDCDSCQYVFNECLRKSLISMLISVQKTTEDELGYALTPRYHYSEFIEWRGDGVYALKSPGILQTEVGEALTPLLTTYPISPYLIQGVTVEDSEQGMCVAVVPISLVSNPGKLDFWDNQGVVVDKQRWPGYPRRVGNNWEIPLGSRCAAPACNTPLSAFHCEYTILETPVLGEEGDAVVPVYPGTTQIIPQMRPVEYTETGMRWFFPISALLDPAFIDENADLSQGEFWKLIQRVGFAVQEEVRLPITMIYDQTCKCETPVEDDSLTDPRFMITVINADRGLIQIHDCSPFGECCKNVRGLEISYRTSPDMLGFTVDLGGILQGMAYYVASLLPLNSCGCATKQAYDSFIETAQKAYTDVRINPVTGETFMPMKFGNLYGQLVFAETLGRMNKFKRGFVL